MRVVDAINLRLRRRQRLYVDYEVALAAFNARVEQENRRGRR